LEFELGQSRQIAQKADRVSIDVPRPSITGAKGSNAAPRDEEREAHIEADAGLPGYQRVIRESRIMECVRHNQHLARRHGVCTERNLPRGLAELCAMRRLEPLAILIYKANEGHWHIQNCSDEAREPVEALFLRRIEDAQAMKSCQPLLLILR
jgi:hypothetical protein